MDFVFTNVGNAFSVTVSWEHVGTVRHRFIRHLNLHGWEATGLDGHRGVHETRDQAAKALVIDLKNYPFPIRRAS